MLPSRSSPSRQDAEKVLAEYLARNDPGSDIEALVRANPGMEGELRRLHSDWVKVGHALGRLRRQPRERSFRVVGSTPAHPREESDGLGSGSSREVLERLAHRASSFGRYKVEAEVAQGGMGAILRVFDEDLGRYLAMKVALGSTTASGEGLPAMNERTLSRFLEEARISAQLDHPGIAPVHELGLDDKGRVYFTMKLVKGRDLKRIFRQIHTGDPEWTRARALGVILKVCEAMAYAHSKNAIHRDLKPSNVMVGRFGEVYVMDWGLARVLGRDDEGDENEVDERSPSTRSVLRTVRGKHTPSSHGSPVETREGDVLGTPAYMAPEQAAGLLDLVGPRSDVYSVGAMLYHLLTGRAPFMPDDGQITPQEVLEDLLHGPPVPVTELAPDAPADLVAICEKAMAREAEDRYAGTLEMGRDIEAYLDRRPVTAGAPHLTHVVRLAIARHKPVAATAAIAASILLAAATLFVVRLEEARADSVERGDLLAVRSVQDTVNDLYPVGPKKVGDMERWLADVDGTLARESRYRALLDSGRVDEDRAAALTAMLAGLDRARALRPVVAERLARARSLRRETVDDHAEDWRRVQADLATRAEYDGLELEPVVGLVPLRLDPGTRFEEFWVPLTGARPEIDEATDRYVIGPETGIVLVLLPGGEYVMGSPEGEEGRQDEHELQHPVTVAPFFAGKYEVTQGQWTRVMGRNVARYQKATKSWASDSHPIETVSWIDSHEFARRLGLMLLTEEQFEYALRAGSQTAFPYGESFESLEARENIKDVSGSVPGQDNAPWDDHYGHHAPVGSFPPNDFGLHDMSGNVSEWCRNPFFTDNATPHADEPYDGSRLYAFRGGSWYHHPVYCRSALRQADAPESRNQARGLRVGLELGR